MSDIVRAYERHKTIAGVMRELGLSRENVRDALVDAGVSLPPRGKHWRPGKRPANEDIVAMYRKLRSVAATADATGTTRWHVAKSLEAAQEPRSERGRHMRRGYTHDERITELAKAQTHTLHEIAEELDVIPSIVQVRIAILGLPAPPRESRQITLPSQPLKAQQQ